MAITRPGGASALAPDTASAPPSGRGAAGDRERFDTLVGPVLDDLHRFAFWLCGDRATAEDLVQEACLRAWRSLDRLREPRAVKSWLFTTLRREHARLHERKRLEIAPDVEPATVADDRDASPDRQLDRDRLREAMRRLPAGYRIPLAMQVLLGYSVREIAQGLALSEAAVMTRLLRARRRLTAEFARPGAAAR